MSKDSDLLLSWMSMIETNNSKATQTGYREGLFTREKNKENGECKKSEE